MSNPHGSPIWYELVTPDPDGAKRFYDGVVGWTMDGASSGDVDYRMISAPGGRIGGVLILTEEMRGQGGRPAWLMYVGVDDVDVTTQQARALGANVFVPPRDIPDVGRFALLADPQGAPFYIMRPAGTGTSEAFAPGKIGHCGWNELSTTDAAGALAFYGALFGWENRETMAGPMGRYHFLFTGADCLGAAAEMKDRPAQWNFYFNVADIDVAVDRVRAGGGAILMGPQEVPTGDRIVLGIDPQEAHFALVARGKK